MPFLGPGILPHKCSFPEGIIIRNFSEDYIILEIMSSLLRLASPPKNNQIPHDAFHFRSYSLGIEVIKTLTLYPFIDCVPPSKTIPREPYPIPDQNGQSVYPFSDLKGPKTLPDVAA